MPGRKHRHSRFRVPLDLSWRWWLGLLPLGLEPAAMLVSQNKTKMRTITPARTCAPRHATTKEGGRGGLEEAAAGRGGEEVATERMGGTAGKREGWERCTKKERKRERSTEMMRIEVLKGCWHHRMFVIWPSVLLTITADSDQTGGNGVFGMGCSVVVNHSFFVTNTLKSCVFTCVIFLSIRIQEDDHSKLSDYRVVKGKAHLFSP